MSDLVIFFLLFAAVAIGWFWGGAARPRPRPEQLFYRPQGGANPRLISRTILCDDLPENVGGTSCGSPRVFDCAVGERWRAVRIHQDLLAGAGLPADDAAQAQLELARDYISAGLLDRAEELLLALVQDFPRAAPGGPAPPAGSLRNRARLAACHRSSQGHAAAQITAPGQQPGGPAGAGASRAARLLAHYCCELAGEERIAGNLQAARRLLLEALFRDPQCVRIAGTGPGGI